MVSVNYIKNMKFAMIVNILKSMRCNGDITHKEYNRAKKYYQRVIDADLIVVD